MEEKETSKDSEVHVPSQLPAENTSTAEQQDEVSKFQVQSFYNDGTQCFNDTSSSIFSLSHPFKASNSLS